MTLEAALIDHLINEAAVVAVAGTRGYPLLIPQGETLPAWAIQRISGPGILAHDGPTGVAEARVQVRCVGETYQAAKGLAKVVRSTVDGFSGTLGDTQTAEVEMAKVVNEQDGYSEGPEVKSVLVDVKYLYQE